MAPGKLAEVEATVESMMEDVRKIGALERSVETLKESVTEIHSRMSVLDRLEKRMNEEEEERKREFAALFQAKQQANAVDGGSRTIQRPGKQISGEEGQSGLFRADTSERRFESVTITGGGRREEEYGGPQHSGDSHNRVWVEYRDKHDERKLKIPLVSGENVESWVLRVEQYFELGEYLEEKKLQLVRMCFDDDALLWYRWERDRNPFESWEQLKYRALEQFSTTHEITARERLLTLKQTETGREYFRDFISLATNAPELTNEVLETAFMIG